DLVGGQRVAALEGVVDQRLDVMHGKWTSKWEKAAPIVPVRASGSQLRERPATGGSGVAAQAAPTRRSRGRRSEAHADAHGGALVQHLPGAMPEAHAHVAVAGPGVDRAGEAQPQL